MIISFPLSQFNKTRMSRGIVIDETVMTHSTLGKMFDRRHFEIFSYFPRKQDLTYHANCLQWRQFAWNVKSCFLGKIRNLSSICRLLNYPWEREMLNRLASCILLHIIVKENLQFWQVYQCIPPTNNDTSWKDDYEKYEGSYPGNATITKHTV